MTRTEKTIRVVREAGGLGDVIRIFAALDGLRDKYPHDPIYYYGPEKYRGLMMDGHCWGMARESCHYVGFEGEAAKHLRICRGMPLKTAMFPYHDRVIDLFCPAWEHELQTSGTVTRERTALFCEAAGVKPRTPRFHLQDEENRAARALFRWCEPDGVMALHIKPAGAIRCWPQESWLRLAEMNQRDEGYTALWIDDSGEYVERLKGSQETGVMPWGVLAGILAEVRLTVSIDSGIFHLAGALGRPVIGLFGPTNGRIVSSIYPTAQYVQAPPVWNCNAICYGYNERGFKGAECLDGCRNLAALQPESVMERVKEILG